MLPPPPIPGAGIAGGGPGRVGMSIGLGRVTVTEPCVPRYGDVSHVGWSPSVLLDTPMYWEIQSLVRTYLRSTAAMSSGDWLNAGVAASTAHRWIRTP